MYMYPYIFLIFNLFPTFPIAGWTGKRAAQSMPTAGDPSKNG